MIGQDVSESDFETNLARRWHTCGGRRIETPRGDHRRPPIFGGFVIEGLFWQAFLAFLAFLAFCCPTPLGRSRPDVARPQTIIDQDRLPVARQVLGKFSASSRHTWPTTSKILKKLSPDPPKSRPGASKIEPGALQDAIFIRGLI